MPELKTIHTRLSIIQKELKAPKNQTNNFGHYNYRSCEDILEAIKPLLKENEIVLLSDKIENLGNRFYIKATAYFRNGNEEIFVDAYAREPEIQKGMNEAQITGSASSYARKYALNGLFLIDDQKDPDTQDNTPQNPPQAPKQPVEPQNAPQTPSSIPAQQMTQGMEEQQNTGEYPPCPKCGAEQVKNPKTGKVFCSNKCWLNQPK